MKIKPKLPGKKSKPDSMPHVDQTPSATQENGVDVISNENSDKIDDILEALRISPSVEVPDAVLLPHELNDIEFDIQVPRGYDEGQVMKFVAQIKYSINFLVDALKKRNEDIAKLATAVDKLQVDANNLRFENEITNGVSIMSSFDPDDAEAKLVEAKLTIQSLEKKISELSQNPSSGIDLTAVGLRDQISTLRSENDALREELDYLKGGANGLPTLSTEGASGALPEMGTSLPPTKEESSLPNRLVGHNVELLEEDEDELDELMKKLRNG